MAVSRLCQAVSSVVLAALPVVARAQVPVAGEFQVNTYTTQDQGVAGVAMDRSGRFMVVWGDSYEVFPDPWFPFWTTYSRGAFGRGFDASGTPYGEPFGIAVGTTLGASPSSVAVDASGDFVVVWQQTAPSLRARRFAPDGTPIGGVVPVNGTSTGRSADVAADASGGFVVVWDDGPHDVRTDFVVARLFDAGDQPASDELVVSSSTTSARANAAVATDAAGNFVVTWTGPPPGTSGEPHVLTRLFDASGAAQGPPFVVSAYRSWASAVARDAEGGFLVAWVQSLYDERPGVFARLFDADGNPVGGEFQVHASTGMRFYSVSAAMDTDESFVLAWDEGPDPYRTDIFVRRFDTAGTPVSAPFRANSYTTHVTPHHPVVAGDGRGNFVVAWTRWFGGGFDPDVIAQRFGPDRLFADGFESGGLSAWSASGGGSNLSVAPHAAMRSSTVGLRGQVNDTQALFVQDDSPRGEHRYRARFYFNTGDFDPGEAQGRFRTRIFIGFDENPTRRLFAVTLRRQGGQYAVMARARGDDDTRFDTGFTAIAPGAHAIEVAWARSSGVDTADGTLELWEDGSLAGNVASLDNDRGALDFVRLGALGVKAGASGTMYWDEFESRRASAIGP